MTILVVFVDRFVSVNIYIFAAIAHWNFSGYHHLLFVSAPILAEELYRERRKQASRIAHVPTRKRRTETLPNRVRASNCRMRYSSVISPLQGFSVQYLA
jgi:hypothetical protein